MYLILLIALLSLSNAADVFWVDWTSTTVEDGVTKYIGVIEVTRPTGEKVSVEVKFSNTVGIAGFQYDAQSDLAGYDWFVPRAGMTGSPYTSSVVSNRPPAYNIIRLRYAAINTLEFSRDIGEPIFAFVSLNVNGYGFDKDFTILSNGEAATGNCGYWGCGLGVRELHEADEPVYKYWLVGKVGEPHGTLQFLGSFNKVVWKSLSNENWNGFTIAIAGLAEDTATGKPCPDQGICKISSHNTITGACEYTDVECPSDQCHDGACDTVSGCYLVPKTGSACDDGDKCTENDKCGDGVCQGTKKECGGSHDCQTFECNINTGECDALAAQDYDDCEDGDICTQADTCQAGVCTSGPRIYCPDQNGGCKINGECDEYGGCFYDPLPDGSDCDDGDYCTVGDTCSGGVCVPGEPVVCSEPDQCQLPGKCNPKSGQCEYADVIDGFPCEDGNACSGDDFCYGGKCEKGDNKLCCRTNGPSGKCGLCVRDCLASYESVLTFFGLKVPKTGGSTKVCPAGGAGDCPDQTMVCCAPKDQTSTISYISDGTTSSCYRKSN